MPSGQSSAALPDLAEYVDLVTELEEILRGSAEDQVPQEPGHHTPLEPVETIPDAVDTFPPPATIPFASRVTPLRARARTPAPVPQAEPAIEGQRGDDEHGAGAGFWQVDDQSWATSPAWREPRRSGRVDLFIIGALVVLIAGGGAYSAIRLGDGGTASLAENGIADNASRAEAGLGVPFASIGRAGLLRDDPTLPVPSLEAAVAGAEVAPLPVIVEPPVEATAPVFLADATDPAPATAAPTPAAGLDAPPTAAPPPAAAPDTPPATVTTPPPVGGPLVPVDPVDITAGVAGTTTTTVTTWVNMRAGPDNGEAVVMVVSPDTTVTVLSCDLWCTVTVNGREGYIFEDFLVAHP